jgi:hypothetical protein
MNASNTVQFITNAVREERLNDRSYLVAQIAMTREMVVRYPNGVRQFNRLDCWDIGQWNGKPLVTQSRTGSTYRPARSLCSRSTASVKFTTSALKAST